MTVESIAEVAYNVNRWYCRAWGDWSFGPWADAPQWQRDTCIAGVKFHLDHPQANAGASHESWMAVKVAEGWKYGPEKDPEKKEHPCMVEFTTLPPEQQAKDFIFTSVVRSLKKFMD
jgi:hypothetical protein